MTVNKSSLYMWKRETTEGTSIINAVDDTAYQFGGYSNDIPEWDIQTIENTISKYWNHNSKIPNLGFGAQDLPIFQTKCHPCSPIPEYQFLGVADEDTVSTISLLDTGAHKDSYTIRHEEREGTNQLIQKVGCFCVGISSKIEINKDEVIIQDWAWQTLEDNGDRSPLTSANQVIFPESINTVYTGKPEITWDVGGGNEGVMSEAFRFEWGQKQNITTIKNGTSHTINMHEYEPIGIQIVTLTSDNNQWDAMRDKTTHDINVKVYKQNDITKYKNLKFSNCVVVKINKIGKTDEGYYITTLDIIAESLNVDFISEFTTLTDWMPTSTP